MKTTNSMRNLIRGLVLFLCLYGYIFSLSSQTFVAYYIGNSVTDAINLNGLKDMATAAGKSYSFGRHMIPGAPLSWIWEHPKDGFSESPYGLYPNALPNYTFNAVSFQPFDRREDEDVPMIQNYVNLAKAKSPNCTYYIYQRWPRTPNDKAPTDASLTADTWSNLWNATYTGVGKWDGTNEARGYFETLTTAVRTNITGILKPYMVPVGEVFYQLNLKMKAGQIPGFTDIWDVYSDGIHMKEAGSYIASCTYYATLFKSDPRGLSVPSAYGTLSTTFVSVVQQTVWDVVTTYKDASSNTWSGVNATTISVTSVSITPTTASVVSGNTVTLTATVLPANASNKTLLWTSDKTNIATVANGVVTGVAAGTAIITATTVDGSKTATSTITVTSSGNTAVSGVSLDKTTAIVNPGETVQLTATIAPVNATNKNVTWTSSKTANATVSTTGLVTGILAGTTVITVKTTDGNYTATSSIRVNAKPVCVFTTTAQSNPLMIAFSASGSSDPDAGDYILGYEWDFGDGSAMDHSNTPTHTYAAAGNYTVKVRVMDNNNLYSNQVTKALSVKTTNLVDETTENIKVYPNPVSDILNVSLKLNNRELILISLYDITGKEVKSIASGEYQELIKTVDVSSLQTGLYFIRIQTGEQITTKQITILH